MFTYEILPKVWKYDEYQFLLRYTSLIYERELLQKSIQQQLLKFTKNASEQGGRSLKRKLFPFQYDIVKNIKLHALKAKKVRFKNKTRSVSKIMIHNKLKFISKVKYQTSRKDKKGKLELELGENERNIKLLVFEFLKSKSLDKQQVLHFRKEMKVPYRLDTLIGFHTARVSLLTEQYFESYYFQQAFESYLEYLNNQHLSVEEIMSLWNIPEIAQLTERNNNHNI